METEGRKIPEDILEINKKLDKLFANRKYSVYKIAKKSGLNYKTVALLKRDRNRLDHMQVGTIKKLLEFGESVGLF